MLDAFSLKLYRASDNNPLTIPDKKVYGDQYALYKKADALRPNPRHTLPRLDCIFAGLSPNEAKQWGNRIWELSVEIPYKYLYAYDIMKWTALVGYYLLHAFKATPETNTKLETLIKEYWASRKPIKEVYAMIKADSNIINRWEILISPDWVTHLEEIKENKETRSELQRKK